MRSRAALAVALSTAVLGGVVVMDRVAAQDEPPAAPGADAPAPPAAKPDVTSKATAHETIAAGSLPDLSGRWLVLNDLDLAGKNRTVASFWEVTERDGDPVVTERFVNLPIALHDALEGRNAAAEKWEPTPDELATLRTSWGDLPDQMRGVAAVRNEIWARDAFIDEIAQEPATKDAEWVVRQTYQFQPGGSRPVRQVNVFGALEATATGWAGTYSGVAVAAAPFPVPIPYNGTFRMIRLDPAPARGLLARLADLFAGCGR